MQQRFNFKSACPTCGVTYLHIPTGVTNSTVIHCNSCDTPLGMWQNLETSFVAPRQAKRHTRGGRRTVYPESVASYNEHE